MQELLGRITRLDPSASLGLRVIACFDELVVGNVNTRALLAAAASLAGCPAGARDHGQGRTQRVDPAGAALAAAGEPPPHAATWTDPRGEFLVWLERDGAPLPNDAIILERLALAYRVRHAKDGRSGDSRRHLAVLLDRETDEDRRREAATALDLQPAQAYRVVTAPLFAVWAAHPRGVEDVIATPFGPIHAVVVPASTARIEATPSGLGSTATPEGLHRSFRTSLVALRLCAPPDEPAVSADDYGGILDLLADRHADLEHSDADRVGLIAENPWGLETVGALVTAQTVREAARRLQVHHSTLQGRLDVIVRILGFNPQEGMGRSRLGMAYVVHRLRTSTVLDLPAPTAQR